MFRFKKFIKFFYVALLFIVFNNLDNHIVARNIFKPQNIALNTQKKDDLNILNPKTISVVISGNIENPGIVEVPTGSGVIQAINIAGGKKLLSGNIEFLRFDKNCKLERKFLSYQINSRNNPQQRPGDIINVRRSAFGVSTEIMNQIASPFISGYSFYNLFSN